MLFITSCYELLYLMYFMICFWDVIFKNEGLTLYDQDHDKFTSFNGSESGVGTQHKEENI